MQKTNPIIQATGGMHIGKSFLMSFQVSWPFGKIEVYEDRIVLRFQYLPDFVLRIFEWAGKIPKMIGSYRDIPKKIELTYDQIKGYKEKDLKAAGYGIAIIHTNNQQAPFLQFWASKDKAKKIIGYLNKQGIYHQD